MQTLILTQKPPLAPKTKGGFTQQPDKPEVILVNLLLILQVMGSALTSLGQHPAAQHTPYKTLRDFVPAIPQVFS